GRGDDQAGRSGRHPLRPEVKRQVVDEETACAKAEEGDDVLATRAEPGLEGEQQRDEGGGGDEVPEQGEVRGAEVDEPHLYRRERRPPHSGLYQQQQGDPNRYRHQSGRSTGLPQEHSSPWRMMAGWPSL